jgi:hypothetical protein
MEIVQSFTKPDFITEHNFSEKIVLANGFNLVKQNI